MVSSVLQPDHLHEVAIIGTGFSGLCAAIKLRQAGIHDFVVLEKAHDVAGVWRDNTYPGCACDIPSHLYSYSFEPNPEWSRLYPSQTELHAYLGHCADKYGVREHVRFGCEVTDGRFDEASGTWRIHLADGQVVRARALINGAGSLNRPAIPELPGIERFQGATFHSARWDHDFDPKGKRVAVIGTGASAIQFVPGIADDVQQMHVFQRTPPWVMPKRNPRVAGWVKRIFRWLPVFQRLFRALLYWGHELGAFNFLKNDVTRGAAERGGREHIESVVEDPALRAQLTPDYRVGCKRILLSNEWYQTLVRDHVELRTDGVTEVREHSVVTGDGTELEVDAIIYGTGFKATEFLQPFEFYGLGGRELVEEWKRGAPSYLGITASGFPNFYIVTGPNTGLGHNSMVFMIEAQVRYIVQCIQRLRESGARYQNVRADVQERFTDQVQAKMQDTVWVSGCKSWYQSADGRVFTLWPDFTWRYWLRTRRMDPEDYEWVGDARDPRPALDAGASESPA